MVIVWRQLKTTFYSLVKDKFSDYNMTSEHPDWFKSYIRQQYLIKEIPKAIEKVKKDIEELKEDMKEKNGNKVE